MKNVFITGVGSGLGHELARQFANTGARVFGLSRTCPLDLADAIAFVASDLGSHSTIPAALQKLLAPVSRLDLAILNAGILGPLQALPDTSEDAFRQVFDINVVANKVILDHLITKGPVPQQVIAISSGAAKNGSAGWGAYSVSKAALNTLLQVYANENPDIHFTALAPGLVYTPMMNSVLSRNAGWNANRRLRAAHQEGGIQSSTDAALAIADVSDRLRTLPSGGFVDMRSLPELNEPN